MLHFFEEQNTSPLPLKMFLEKLFVPSDDILKLIMFGLVTENYTVLCQGGEY